MINVGLALLAFVMAVFCEVLSCLQKKKVARAHQITYRLSARQIGYHVGRPILAGVVVWVLAVLVERQSAF